MSRERATKAEQGAIDALKRVAKTWPKSLWLYSASGSLCVMKKKDGKRAMVATQSPGPGFDPEYLVDEVQIENDGG